MHSTPEESRPKTVTKRLKVRTGCITCKIRKVKCDEKKPACKRCTDTGRKCDGYALPVQKPKKNGDRSVISWISSNQKTPPPIAPRAPLHILPNDAVSISNTLAGEERQWIAFFSLWTGPALASVFSHPFWSHTLPQISVSEPAVRHALLAVGSFHARFEAEVIGNQQVVDAISRDSVVRHYNQAITHLQQRLARQPKEVEIPLICCLLFICLECLYGNRDLVVNHLRNGLNILQTQLHDKNVANESLVKKQLRPIFHRLDAQSTLFGNPVSAVFGSIEDIQSIKVSSSFADFEEARLCFDKISGASLAFVRLVYDGMLTKGVRPSSARHLQQHLQEQYKIWRSSLDQLVESRKANTSDTGRREKLLRVQHVASYIWLSTCLEEAETKYDAYMNEFTEIVDLAKGLTNSVPDGSLDQSLNARFSSLSISGSPKFSLNMAFMPPLYLTAIKCRDPVIRRQAITISEQTQGREGLWDARLHGRVARRIVEIEESSMFIFNGAQQVFMEQGPAMRMHVDGRIEIPMCLPEERFRVYDPEIKNVGVKAERSCSVHFHAVPNGQLGEPMTWTEEIIF